jgi:hypothetical protein
MEFVHQSVMDVPAGDLTENVPPATKDMNSATELAFCLLLVDQPMQDVPVGTGTTRNV